MPMSSDVPATIRAEERLFRELPTSFRDALEFFDPGGDALVLVPPYSAVTEIAGRRVYGARRPEWVALEDKTSIDEVLAAAEVPIPRHEIVDASAVALADAAARLDAGTGTVWAGDAHEGFNGGSAYVRWVGCAEDAAEAADHLAAHCARVRVAPFVEGIPCSVHGLVSDDDVAVFRPVELMTLRSATPPRLRFAGASTMWDPPAPDRTDMRAAAVRLGGVLRDRVGFRGVFTIDGILSADGWVATECNPRFGAGLQYARAAVPMLPLDLVHHAVIEGDARSVPAREIQDVVLASADETRWGATWIPAATAWTDSASIPLAGDEHGYSPAAAGESADATLSYGPGPTGGFVRCEFDAMRTRVGPSTAARAVAALAFADEHCGAGIGPLQAPVAAR
jgi:hypothetical protein